TGDGVRVLSLGHPLRRAEQDPRGRPQPREVPRLEPHQPPERGHRAGVAGGAQTQEVIAERVAAVRERIARAAARAGRREEDLTLVAVRQTLPADAVPAAFA